MGNFGSKKVWQDCVRQPPRDSLFALLPSELREEVWLIFCFIIKNISVCFHVSNLPCFVFPQVINFASCARVLSPESQWKLVQTDVFTFRKMKLLDDGIHVLIWNPEASELSGSTNFIVYNMITSTHCPIFWPESVQFLESSWNSHQWFSSRPLLGSRLLIAASLHSDTLSTIELAVLDWGKHTVSCYPLDIEIADKSQFRAIVIPWDADLLAISHNTTISILKLSTRELLERTFMLSAPPKKLVACTQASNNNRHIIGGYSESGMLALWNFDTGACLARLNNERALYQIQVCTQHPFTGVILCRYDGVQYLPLAAASSPESTNAQLSPIALLPGHEHRLIGMEVR